MRIGFWTIVACGFIVGAVAPHTYAWGPATHVGLAATVLDGLALLPAGIAILLSRYRQSFLYGNVAADVVFAKRLSRVKQFCHHWSTGFSILDRAEDDASRAFAYGYLCHLAADTVAHTKYVPRQVMASACPVDFGHVYWEIRADTAEPEAHRRLLRRLLAGDHAHHHQALAGHLAGAFLPYDLNRLMFNGVNALSARERFRRRVDRRVRLSRWHLPTDLVQGYRQECVDRIHAVLARGERSVLLREDPNGTSALMQVKVRRREIRRLRRRGIPTTQRRREATRALAPQAMGRYAVGPPAAPNKFAPA